MNEAEADRRLTKALGSLPQEMRDRDRILDCLGYAHREAHTGSPEAADADDREVGRFMLAALERAGFTVCAARDCPRCHGDGDGPADGDAGPRVICPDCALEGKSPDES